MNRAIAQLAAAEGRLLSIRDELFGRAWQLGKLLSVPRLGTAHEVADLICFAASDAAGYITGASLDINGGDLMM